VWSVCCIRGHYGFSLIDKCGENMDTDYMRRNIYERFLVLLFGAAFWCLIAEKCLGYLMSLPHGVLLLGWWHLSALLRSFFWPARQSFTFGRKTGSLDLTVPTVKHALLTATQRLARSERLGRWATTSASSRITATSRLRRCNACKQNGAREAGHANRDCGADRILQGDMLVCWHDADSDKRLRNGCFFNGIIGSEYGGNMSNPHTASTI
jgi:hypothetical protein